MDECIKRLASYKYVSVWVLHNNTKAILWYEKYGFKKDGKARSIPVLNNYQLDELRMTFIL